MKILMVGSGGREHALIKKLKESPKCTEIYCAPGNGGIAKDATIVNIGAMDIDNMVAYAKDNAIDMVFVAPDDPLAAGMVDAMEEAGIRAFGPKANAAIIEASKVFSKNLMKKYNIPTAKYEVFDDAQKAIAYVEAENTAPVVVKAEALHWVRVLLLLRLLKKLKTLSNPLWKISSSVTQVTTLLLKNS